MKFYTINAISDVTGECIGGIEVEAHNDWEALEFAAEEIEVENDDPYELEIAAVN